MYICKHSTRNRDTKINTIITSQSFVNTDTNNTRKHAEKHYLLHSLATKVIKMYKMLRIQRIVPALCLRE
jgi:hypothetical protein